jgi:hypothetical protein
MAVASRLESAVPTAALLPKQTRVGLDRSAAVGAPTATCFASHFCKFFLKWRAVPRPNRATYRLLLRFVASGSSSLSSQLFLEALGCSRRVLGLILRLYLRCIRSPPRTQRSSSLFLDGRGARSFNADERLLLQEKGRMLIPGRESAHGSKAPARENVGLVALRRLTCVVRQPKLGSCRPRKYLTSRFDRN